MVRVVNINNRCIYLLYSNSLTETTSTPWASPERSNSSGEVLGQRALFIQLCAETTGLADLGWESRELHNVLVRFPFGFLFRESFRVWKHL